MMINYLIDLIIGAITGYGTNNIAIKMLFKKYPILGGGVIADRYDEFIKNMSELVEKDLLNHKTLMNELNSEKFRLVLKKIITATIKHELPQTSGHLSLSTLSGIESSFENLNAYIQANLDTFLDNLLEILSDKTLADLISEEQYSYILAHGSQHIFANLKHYETEISRSCYSFLSGQSLRSLISEDAINKITENIIELINRVDFSKYDALVNDASTELGEIIDLDVIISNIETEFKKMKVADFVNNSANLSQELLKKIVAFINSKDGFRLLTNLIDNILDELEKITMTLNELLDESFLNSLEKFISDRFPTLLANVIDLISVNTSEIEILVNEAIDEELDKHLFLKIFKSLINLFFKNLAGKFSIVEKITVAIQEYGEAAPKILIHELLNYLRTNSISNIIKNLRKENIVTSPMLTRLLQRNIQDLNLEKISFLDDFLAKEVGQVFTFDFLLIKKELLPYFLEKFKSEYLYSAKFKDRVTKKVTEFIENNKDIKIANFIKISDIYISLGSESLKRELKEQYPVLSYIVGSDFKFHPKLELDLTKQWDKFKDFKLGWIYDKINNDQAFTNIEKAVHDLIQNNLKNVLKNNISSAAKRELDKSNPEEISAMVEEFMGKELKPINTFGAVLGAIMSGGYAVASMGTNHPYIMLGLSPLVYGIAGIATNKIAIWMLFKPYKPWLNFLPLVSPFVGLVPAQKPKFAKNLSSFVKSKLLSDDSIKELYYQERVTALNSLVNSISANNFAVVDLLLKEEGFIEKLTNFSFQELVKLTSLNADKLAIILAKKIKSSLNNLSNDDLIMINSTIVAKLYSGDFSSKIQNYIEDRIADRKIGEQSKFLVNILAEKIDIMFENIADGFSYNNFVKLANNYKQEFKNYISDNSVNDFVGNSFVNSLAQKLVNLLQKEIARDSLLKPLITYLTEQEFNPDNRLNELFNGALPNLLKKNVVYLLDIITNEIEANKAEIKSNIMQDMVFGKSEVGPIVDNLIANKLPLFLQAKETDIIQLLLPILEYKLGEVGFDEQSLKLASLEINIREVLNNNEIKRSISKIAQDLLIDIADMPLDQLLKIINIKYLSDLVLTLAPLLKYAVQQFSAQLANSSDKLAKLSKVKVGEILTDILTESYYQDLLKDIDLNQEIKKIIELLKADVDVEFTLNEIIKDLLYRLSTSKDLYSEELLIVDLEKIINSSLGKDLVPLKNIIIPFLKDLLLNINSLLETETKRELLTYLLESVFESLASSLDEVIASIDIERVVHDEVNNMQAKEIEDLFNSFAKDYFDKLVRYGSIGAIPGLIVMLAKIILR